MTENITRCEDWFWRAFRGGMYLAGNNLRHYYEAGDEGMWPRSRKRRPRFTP